MRSQKNLLRSSNRSLPLNAFKTANEYGNWIDQLIVGFVDPERIAWQPIENYLQWNSLFVTLTFDKRKIRRRQSVLNDSSGTIGFNEGNIDRLNKDNLSPEFFNIDRLYKKVCAAILGRNYSRHRQSQPLLIAAADINGTRYGSPLGEMQNLHLHTIWVFKKGQIDKARAKLEEVMVSDREHEFDFDQVHIDEVGCFNPGSRSVSQLSSYVSKFLGFNADRVFIECDISIYPIGKPEKDCAM
ncbi:hypothetical protein NOJ05_07030 [Neorhizobium galegae]|uniref:hypothetical protein n=1 Tax=Neorhizobium galegae TaxID=399 RepID=UPI0021028685|nr:hypothetical protein [Neorhizobium galegae]MCQ1776949.1 hypothetical protein [Neorhizobium galegae]MCQ1795861.1 hypothetical protein [Neorhizobium galegae]